MPKRILIFGTSGSIGKSALDLIRENPTTFKLVGAHAHQSETLLQNIADEFKVDTFLSQGINPSQIRQAILDFIETTKPDVILNAVLGFAGLPYTLGTLEAEIPLALANKESLVCAGELVMQISKTNQTPIIPVDSEHAALFECLHIPSAKPLPEYRDFSKILLTCSGGPFHGFTAQQLQKVTKEQALTHPNWDMGASITIDSASLANKCLEVFEAMHLFSAQAHQIEIVIHRESIIHSMVELPDSSILAQMAPPDMKLPIAQGLNFPNKADYQLPRQGFKNLSLTFDEPDKTVFRTLQVLNTCMQEMGPYPIVFNAAKEVAVQQFLNDKISFVDIFNYIEKAMTKVPPIIPDSVESIYEIDRLARSTAL